MNIQEHEKWNSNLPRRKTSGVQMVTLLYDAGTRLFADATFLTRMYACRPICLILLETMDRIFTNKEGVAGRLNKDK
jgi:hypothetical protein